MVWQNNEGTHHVENNSEKPSTNRTRDDNDFYRSMPAKMKWPPTSEVQSQFTEQAKLGYQYSELETLIPEFDMSKECLHCNKFDQRDPEKWGGF